MKTLDVKIGDLKLSLPDWEQEISFISRAGAPGDAHRPNVRVTYRTATEPVSLERLADEYRKRLGEGVAGTCAVVRQTKRSRSGQELIELVLKVDLSGDAQVHHQVIIAIRGNTAITVAASRQAELGDDASKSPTGDTDVVDALVHTLASVGFTSAR